MGVIDDYFMDLIAQKRAQPADDMLTDLIHAEEEGDKLTEAELLSTVMLLFVAGYETTTNLIGNGLRALLLFPAQLQRLRDDRSLLKPAIEEILRYDSPVQLTGRIVLDDGVEVAGIPVDKGQELITLLGAANRDPRSYPYPDTFDIGRGGPAPISFLPVFTTASVPRRSRRRSDRVRRARSVASPRSHPRGPMTTRRRTGTTSSCGDWKPCPSSSSPERSRDAWPPSRVLHLRRAVTTGR